GPEGGTAAVGDVRLTIPPGALSGPTAIGILPEVNPLPIEPPPNDPCTYALLGPQWCCGPRGLELLADGRLVLAYDPALIPVDATEDDLVLLLWDEAQGALVPASGAVTQDTTAHFFQVDDYRQLGHMAVAVRTCPMLGFVVLGVNPLLQPPRRIGGLRLAGGAPAANGPSPSGLYHASLDGTTPPVLLATGETLPQGFVPSPDGSRVLFEIVDFGESYYPRLWSVGLEDTQPTLLAGADDEVASSDPTQGWMRDGTRVFFQSERQGVDQLPESAFATVPGDGSAAASALYPLPPWSFVNDVRQSPDGTMVLILYYDDSEEEVLDVFDAATGDVLSSDRIPTGFGQATPRFLPDSTGVYIVDTTQHRVVAYDPDGTNPRTLFTLPSNEGFLKDFVFAPNGDDYAFISFLPLPLGASLPTGASVAGADGLHVGSLSAGGRGSADLGENYFYDELYVHPNGENVFLYSWSLGVRMVSMSDASQGPGLPIADLRGLDINREDGRLLLTVPPPLDLTDGIDQASSVAAELPPGVYVADADGPNIELVTMPDDLLLFAARWLRSVRTTAGMPYSNRIRWFAR
ncbi:MAG: hypothetical protein ACC662_11250, partial [Planctomycetota bacterium]